jgi:ferredoxin-type protein NapG
VSERENRSRREFLTGWFDVVRGAAVGGHARPADPETALRPPGAVQPDEAFAAACTGCGDCVSACPKSSLVMIEHTGERSIPVINPSAVPCYLCDDLPCIRACEDGALIDPGGPERVRLGLARVDPRRCVTFKGETCRHCYIACPYPDRAIMLIGTRPLIGSGACTGCGLCERACPEHPKAITVIAERNLVPGLRVPKDEYAG